MNNNNQLRTVEDLISIEGWLLETEDFKRMSVHLDVLFGEARLGGDPRSEVRFRVKVKKCQVLVELPQNADIGYEKASVSRTPPLQTEITRMLKVANEAGLEANLSLSPNDLKMAIAALLKAKRSTETTATDTRVIPVISATYQSSNDGSLCWRLEPEIGEFLEGAVWDANEEPRFNLSDHRTLEKRLEDRENGFPPNVVIKICCKREDIEIYEIEMKNSETQGFLAARKNQAARLAAAEGYLKHIIFEQGLAAGDMGEVFSDILLAEYILPIET